jgi:hypothetical protein
VIAALLALLIAHPLLDLGGDSVCPTPAEVRDRLAQLSNSTAGDPGSVRHRANLSSKDGMVHVELLGPDGRLLAERTLDKTGSCADLAEAAAVVISSWEAEFSPNVATSVVLPPPAPPARPAPALPEMKAVQPEPHSPMRFDVGIGLLASITGGEIVPGLAVAASLSPPHGHLGLAAALSASSTHSQSVGSLTGAAHWTRVAMMAGPQYRVTRNAMMLDVHAGGAVALLRVEGVGLPSTASDTSAPFGLGAGLRGMRGWNNAAGWIGLDLLVYPGRDQLNIGGLGDSGQLPHVEVQIATGLSLGRFP